MQNLPISLLITPDAKAARSDLLAALGSENNPAQWMDFMDTVRSHLPDVLSRGRPSSDAIKKSLIGKFGFTTWRQMVEAPTDQYGLGWSWSAWRQWSRAWKIIEDHPALRNVQITAAQTNKLAELVKAENVQFPESEAELNRFREQLDADRIERKEKDKAAEAAKLQNLESEIAELKAKFRRKIAEDQQIIRRVEGERDEARRSVDLLQKRLENRPAPVPEKLSRWQHFRAAFGLR